MAVSAHDVARELRQRLPHAGAVKIHKLLYYCQGWHLAWTDAPLFEEGIEAWANGPVVADLWRAEKYGNPIPGARPLDDAMLSTIGYVLSRYGRLNGRELIQLTHGETPWVEVSEQYDDWYSPDIRHDMLAKFFGTDEETARLDQMASWALADPDKAPLFVTASESARGETDSPEEIQRRLAAFY